MEVTLVHTRANCIIQPGPLEVLYNLDH